MFQIESETLSFCFCFDLKVNMRQKRSSSMMAGLFVNQCPKMFVMIYHKQDISIQ